MAGSAVPDSGRSTVSSQTGGPRLGSRDREESVYSDRKREDVRLLLAASVPQGRIAKLTGVSLRTIRRIAREPAKPTKPQSGAKPRRGARASVGGRALPARRRGHASGRTAAEGPESAAAAARARLRRRQVGAVRLGPAVAACPCPTSQIQGSGLESARGRSK